MRTHEADRTDDEPAKNLAQRTNVNQTDGLCRAQTFLAVGLGPVREGRVEQRRDVVPCRLGGVPRRRGAGGNRTPVQQSENGPDTTIPDFTPTQVYRRVGCSPEDEPRIVFPNRQRSFSPSAVFPAVIPHFCCRAVMDWPRAALLLTMTLYSSEMNQAARANCSSAILLVAPFSESEQLGSQTRPTVLMSKPVSPEIVPGNGM